MKKFVFTGIVGLIILSGISYLFFFKNYLKKNVSPTVNIPQNFNSDKREFGKEFTIVSNLDIPWSLAFLPNGNLLITERNGKVFMVSKNFNDEPKEMSVINGVKAGEGGLLGIAIHPNYDLNNYIYLYYTYGESGGNSLNRVSKFVFDGNSLKDEEIILDNIPGNNNHNGGRIKFGPDGLLYIGTGDAQNPSLAQNKNSLAGKILRVNDDGKPVKDNPFGNEVYSYGHRNVQGLTWDETQALWTTEHGASAKDELNKIEKGGNYGWPEITGNESRSNMKTPVVNSENDTWAPSGLIFHDGFLYFAGLRGRDLFKFNPKNKALEKLFNGKYGRIRDVIAGPDNALYITTNNTDGRGLPGPTDDRIIRLEP